jgi:hypothetical protein
MNNCVILVSVSSLADCLLTAVENPAICLPEICSEKKGLLE